MTFVAWRSMVLGFVLFLASGVWAGEREIVTGLRNVLAEKPSSARESLVSGFYSVYFPGSELIGPRVYADEGLTVVGNAANGYMHLTGTRRGQDLTPEENAALYRDLLGRLAKSRFPTYVFGNGSREVLLFTAYDCPYCRKLEEAFLKEAKRLDVTVYLVPTALNYGADAQGELRLKGVLCAPDKTAAWSQLILKRQAASDTRCDERTHDYAMLARIFPVKVPLTVPTAITLADGKIYPQVLPRFNEVFGTK